MKSFKNGITVLGVINLLGAVACTVIMIGMMSQEKVNWQAYIPIVVILLINAVVFIFVGDLGERMDKVEAALKANNILFDKEKDEPQQTNINGAFKLGEPIKVKSTGKTGIIKKVVSDDKYLVELDDDRDNTKTINKEDLKSYFEE